MQNLNVPSSFLTRWVFDTHTLLDGSIISFWSISWTPVFILWWSSGDSLLAAIGTRGESVVGMACCTYKVTCVVFSMFIKIFGNCPSRPRRSAKCDCAGSILIWVCMIYVLLWGVLRSGIVVNGLICGRTNSVCWNAIGPHA